MYGSVLVVLAVVLFLAAFKFYGGFLSKSWELSNNNKTPAEKFNDDNNYVPTEKVVVLGHQFSSIAGAGPITGVISALAFGWLPTFLWIVIGTIFIGGVHDFSSLVASLRHDGKSIGEIIRTHLGNGAKKLFDIFAWLTLMLVLGAFTYFVAASFADTAVSGGNLYSGTGPSIATASFLICIAAIIFGLNNHIKKPLLLNSIICVGLLVLSIYIGFRFPFLNFSIDVWFVLVSLYILLAANLPQWIMLQPRGYLVSYLLYGVIALGLVGVIVCNPSLDKIQVMNMNAASCGGNLFPFLFVTIACGAVSGFHSLVSSGTSSKTLAREVPDAKIVGYGAMLIEGLFAVIVIGIAAVAKDAGSEVNGFMLFYAGIGSIFEKFGLPYEAGYKLGGLAFSMFCLTSLDSATRIARYIFTEMFEGPKDNKETNGVYEFLSGKKNFVGPVIATLTTVVPGYILSSAKYGTQASYNVIWPIFGSANQLLAAVALLAISSWLLDTAKKKSIAYVTILPTIFMFAVTLTALALSFASYCKKLGALEEGVSPVPTVILMVLAVLLFVLAVSLIVKALNIFVFKKAKTN